MLLAHNLKLKEEHNFCQINNVRNATGLLASPSFNGTWVPNSQRIALGAINQPRKKKVKIKNISPRNQETITILGFQEAHD